MKDRMIKLCREVISNEGNTKAVACQDINCMDCIFSYTNNGDRRCTQRDDEDNIQIAKDYLSKHNESNIDFKTILTDIEKEFEKAKDLQELDYHYEGIIDHIYCLYHVQLDRLKRKTYTFNEAFRAYEEGKEIESEYGFNYRKINDRDYVLEDEEEGWKENDESFTIGEIRGRWYINE